MLHYSKNNAHINDPNKQHAKNSNAKMLFIQPKFDYKTPYP